jgi:hypothetical protein
MRTRRDRMDVVEVPDEGHAPLLTDAGSIGFITAFVAACDATEPDHSIVQANQGEGATEKLAGASPR